MSGAAVVQFNTVPRLAKSVGFEEVAACLREQGCCIIERLIDPETVRAINSELAGPVADTRPAGFLGSGQRTRRTGALVAISPATRPMIAHPTITAATRLLLRPSSGNIQVAVTQHICVDPGEARGGLHRDDCAWSLPPFTEPTEVEVSSIWALDDFSPENGATLIAPGSHRGADDPSKFADRTIAAEMPSGSVALYTGRTVHGSGANRTSHSRRAVHITYCTDWLRQKENQFLSVPLEIARTLDPELQTLLGYAAGGFVAIRRRPRSQSALC